MAYQEFYVNAAGSNLNGGSGTGAATATYAGGTFVRATGVFTVASGNPVTDGVTVGQYASIYTTAGATVATFIGRVTARDATTITVSLTAISGATTTVDESAGAATCKVGGSWSGPTGTVVFPFGFIGGTATGLDGATVIYPRVNFYGADGSTADYTVSAAMTHNVNGPVRFEGYHTSAGDGARAVISGGTAAITLLTVSGTSVDLANLVFVSTATSGTSHGVYISGGNVTITRCVVHGFRAIGWWIGQVVIMSECEAYDCNKGNTDGYAAFYIGSYCHLIRCIAHDNAAGANAHGFRIVSNVVAMLNGCIADTNAGCGLYIGQPGTYAIRHCDFYGNTLDGIRAANATAVALLIENCNFISNTLAGFNGSGAGTRIGRIVNCGYFGNGSADAGYSALEVAGAVTYAASPYVDPANGDFRINLATAIGAGRGAFTQTATSYAGAVSAPVIGACQVANYPAAANVRSGTSYANGGYTGTMLAAGGGAFRGVF